MKAIGVLIGVLLLVTVTAARMGPGRLQTRLLTGRWQVVRIVTTTHRPGRQPCCSESGALRSLTFSRRRVTRELLAGGACITTRERYRARGRVLVSRSLAWDRSTQGTVGWTTYAAGSGRLVLTVYEESARGAATSRETLVELVRPWQLPDSSGRMAAREQ